MNLTASHILENQAWYCVRTQPKHEHIAGASLLKRLGLEVFLPRLRLERATRRGPVNVVEPLFPCYLFVRCSLGEHADSIRHTYGVSSLVHFSGQVPPVPDPVIEELRQCFEEDEPMSVQERISPGDEVTVAEGAFLGSRGVVVRFLPARQRVQVLLEFLGRMTVAEVDRRSLVLENRGVADFMPTLAIPSAERIAAVG